MVDVFISNVDPTQYLRLHYGKTSMTVFGSRLALKTIEGHGVNGAAVDFGCESFLDALFTKNVRCGNETVLRESNIPLLGN